MVPTTSHGPRTNTSLSIADHAGPKALLPLSLIDSTSSSRITTPLPSASTHKSSSTAEPVARAKVAILVVFMSSPTAKVFPTPLANNMSPTIQAHPDAVPLTSARTAPGLHAPSTRLARINVGLLTTGSTMLPTTTASLVPTR